ncbi:hypothetical protein [Christiangramia sabulilitoris]|uniref:Uncharacterized protein n=1 Tax=Christiangramia sabulilitoris TaxID=2583991 RepID=A0A550I2S3_9FLAO|nr:hypothetical protein [Christiangramia sabulilitoris]TRO65280.1 hypothetical protein FGM01_07685 [Christiangramia sabulilitoris]
MQRINRKLGFFKRHHFTLFGFFWLVLGVFYFLLNLGGDESLSFNWIIGIAYLVVGLLYLFQAYRSRNKDAEYIEWNHEKLNYKPNMGKVHSYKLESLINITVSKNNLIIKAPGAQGTMAPLKGYSKDDISKLRGAFQDH